MKQYTLILAFVSLFILNGCDKKATEPEPTPKEDKLEPTLNMAFAKPTLNGIGFMDIVFTADGRAAALSTRKEVFFSNNDGATWQLVRQYSALNNDTTIQSLALHPTQDIVFLGASFFHNGNSNLKHLIIKKDGAGKWQDHIIVDTRYTDQASNPQKIPAGFTYNHSFWFRNYVINSFTNPTGTDGFVSIQFDPEKTDKFSSQMVMLPASKNPFVATSVIPIGDDYDKMYNCAGSEILPSKVKANTRIYQWHNFTWLTSNSSDNTNRPDCCLPDYMAASPDLKGKKFNKLMLYTGLGKLYHTHIAPAAHHQQEIILPKDVVGHGDKLCVGIDRQGYVWLGTAASGMFKSTSPLP
ncbi:MAG: hypothetical protein REI64_10515 [Pedobacter sp.]|uniref:hypothetical protein n=1 Tax=Pedobacter sp. TaxID=1411316 RepID=UPI0028082CBE|nr:hypothetical protein [Pedobacter sp.]MDQ8005222.1 hypothetical protein [Pedobacter sp.]